MLSIWFWIMYCCIPTHTTDSNTRTGMIWVTLNMPSAAEECRKLSVNRQGILHCLESGHLVKDILMKTSLDCYTVVNLNHFIVSVLSIKVLLPQWDLLLNINILLNHCECEWKIWSRVQWCMLKMFVDGRWSLIGLKNKKNQCKIFNFVHLCNWCHFQGYHLSGKPGNVREFDICQENVRDFTKNQGNVREKILSGKSWTVYCKLHICIDTGI